MSNFAPLEHIVPPRCPPNLKAETIEDLLPYLDSVARRPYSQGLHMAWDLQPGERILLLADNWYDPRCVEACVQTIKKYGCSVDVRMVDRGPIRQFDGHDEVEIFLDLTVQLHKWYDEWREIEREGKYDKLLWGFGGPVLSDSKVKIQRMPFITPEMIANNAHIMPYEVLRAIDHWTWLKSKDARRVRITDPEGTDVTYTNRDEYYDPTRTFFREDWVEKWMPSNKGFWRSGELPGHIFGKPWFLHAADDASGVLAGTMNHIGPFPHMRMHAKNGQITAIDDGGLFGEKLRNLKKRTDDLQYPGHPGKGLFWWWEVSIGTNPKIHRPRKDYLQGWVCGLYERMRSGVIHIGYGTVTSSDLEQQAHNEGLPAGHWHIHLYFPTMVLTMADGSEELLIENGHLKALDDPGIREIAAKYGDPDEILREDWIPAVPGINMEGDYWRDYAQDPTAWTKAELAICGRWHNLFMRMVQPRPKEGIIMPASCGHQH